MLYRGVGMIIIFSCTNLSVCQDQQVVRSVGGNVTFSSLLSPNESCFFIFKHSNRYITCCYSIIDDHTQKGGCNPNMQSWSCRKGVQKPILVASQNSCTFHIPSLLPIDDGNYLSSFKQGTPQFKSNLKVYSSSLQPGTIIFMIVLLCIFVCALIVGSHKEKY